MFRTSLSSSSLTLVALSLVVFAFAGCVENASLPFLPSPGPACEDGDTTSGDEGCSTCSCDAGEWVCVEAECSSGECAVDTDCFVSGCSGQVCAATEVDSDCGWLPEYACYADPITSCGCNAGVCGWAATDALDSCLAHPPCTEGESRIADDGCNECVCDESGSWDCTELACPGPECEPGDVTGECDECFCDEEGFWACADLICPDCEAGDVSGECDECLCSDDGFWECSDIECPPPECAPGEVGGRCDECICDDDGFWACVPIDCPEPGCTPGDVGGECDECVCDDSGVWLCGDVECTCVAGDVVPAPDGCNTCTCMEDGSWACTEIACSSDCSNDDDCIVTGCSGQLCASEDIATTCEWLPAYACFAPPTTRCGCFGGGCMWEPTDALTECLALD